MQAWLRAYWLECILSVVLLAAVGYFAWVGWGLLPEPPEEPPRVFSGERAYTHVLAQTDLGPRPSGSSGAEATRKYIASHLAAEGWEVITQTLTYSETVLMNIVGKLGEGAPVIVGAHYDTRREADQDPDPEKRAYPVLGANDGASGAAVLLELAHVLQPEDLHNEVWLAFFDAEDNGGLDGWDWAVGSTHMASEWVAGRPPGSEPIQETEEISQSVKLPEFVIVVDMVGDADQRIYLEPSSNLELMASVWSLAGEMGYEEYFVPEYGVRLIDDHTPFLESGIDAIDIIDSDYAYWHTTEDTPDKVSAESLHRVGSVVEAFLEDEN